MFNAVLGYERSFLSWAKPPIFGIITTWYCTLQGLAHLRRGGRRSCPVHTLYSEHSKVWQIEFSVKLDKEKFMLPAEKSHLCFLTFFLSRVCDATGVSEFAYE
jgi:hypothetical protein